MLLQRLSPFGSLYFGECARVDDALELQLPPAPVSVAVARRALVDRCHHWGVADLADVGALAISELVSNAVLHARTPILVMAEHDRGFLTVAVTDGESSLPVVLPPDEERENGRGMAIIEQLGNSWGVQRTALGKTVWVSLSRDGTSLADLP